MRRWFLVAAMPFAIIVVTLPFLIVAKWDGQFTLAVRLETAPNVDMDSIAYAECWRAEEAELLTKHCHADVWAFKPTDEKSGSTHRLQVRCSGD
jgi:hypothetical protein